jgi:hypothetical protein
MKVDSGGNLYMAGWVESGDFPLQNPLPYINYRYGTCFITKLNPNGSSLVYSTYLGGMTGLGTANQANAIAVDGSGSAYVTGFAAREDFPTKNPIQAAYGPGFLSKLGPSGNTLVYSTFLHDTGMGVGVDGSGSAIVVGTASQGYPLFHPIRSSFQGSEAFVSKVNPAGSAFVYSTLIGGSGSDSANGVALDNAGDAYVVGQTTSPDFPLTNAFRTTMSGAEGWLAKVNPGGSRLEYCTFLGGSGDDSATAVVVDSSDNAVLLGVTSSTDYPVKNAAHASPASIGFNDQFGAVLSKFNGDGSQLIFSTFLPANYYGGIGVDGSGNLYADGYANTAGLPLLNPLADFHGSTWDAYVTAYDPFGGLTFATYLGGAGEDFGDRIAADGSGAYVGGFTRSPDFPVTAGAFQTDFNATDGLNGDIFVTKIDMRSSAPQPTVVNTPPAPSPTFTPPPGTTATFTPPPGSTATFTPPPGSSATFTPVPGPFSSPTPVSGLGLTPGSTPAPLVQRYLVPCPVRVGEPVRLVSTAGTALCSGNWQVYNSAGVLVSRVMQAAGESAALSTDGMAPGVYHFWIKLSCQDGTAGEFRQKVVILP